jgi:hypothetical protein
LSNSRQKVVTHSDTKHVTPWHPDQFDQKTKTWHPICKCNHKAGNLSDEGGNLVFEIVCRFPVTQTDAKAACQGYTDHVMLPPVGSHVRIVGSYVQDTFHAQWIEIHPVTSISVVP